MRVSRSIAAVALGSALVLTGCADGGEDDEGIDTSINGEDGGDSEDEGMDDEGMGDEGSEDGESEDGEDG